MHNLRSAAIAYINESEVDLYYKLYDMHPHVNAASKVSFEMSLLGPKVTQHIENKKEELTAVDKLMALCDHWIKHKLISYRRPMMLEDNYEDGEFVFEDVLAHKFFFPKSKLTEINDLDHLVVWVAEPNPRHLTTEPWVYAGTFLILVETLYDWKDFYMNLSGCSALQALSNIITGQPFYTVNRAEPFGRWNVQHPFQKLESMGAIYLHEQQIRTVYRKRYMTNEQRFEYKGTTYRCNDLLGYPMFVC